MNQLSISAPTNVAQETIVAIATARGSGGIGIIRVSGSSADEIAKKMIGYCPKPRYADYSSFLAEDGSVIDHGIAIYYPAPHSFTGESILELHAHGGSIVLQMLLLRCIKLGARQAKPGEFTQRAYLNGKIDLLQAEAIADLINAESIEAVRGATRSLMGEFSKAIQSFLEDLIHLRVHVEACLDFSEEEVDFMTQDTLLERIQLLNTKLTHIFACAKQGQLLREGITIVLAGEPNVGKSTLINQLVGEEVAIVTPIAGTTRDLISCHIQLNGFLIKIIDTAGITETTDIVEQIGIAKTKQAIEDAHIILVLLDVTQDVQSQLAELLPNLPEKLLKIYVYNKIDLCTQKNPLAGNKDGRHIFISAKTGEGIEILKDTLQKAAGKQESSEGIWIARTRHLTALNQVSVLLKMAIQENTHLELIAENLANAQRVLGEITGEFISDDLLGEIFSQFCIGK